MAATSAAAVSERKRRKPVHLNKLTSSPMVGRLAIANHFNRTAAELAPSKARPALAAFEPRNLAPWIANYLKFAFTKKHPFPDYAGSNKQGVYSIEPSGG